MVLNNNATDNTEVGTSRSKEITMDCSRGDGIIKRTVVALLFMSLFLVVPWLLSESKTIESEGSSGIGLKSGSNSNSKSNINSNKDIIVCKKKCSDLADRTVGDLFLLDGQQHENNLQQLVKNARGRLITKLKIDYGEENIQAIFGVSDDDNGRVVAHPPLFVPITEDGPSTSRLYRKLSIKILSAQIKKMSTHHHSSSVGGGSETMTQCDCDVSGKKRRQMQEEIPTSSSHFFEKYVWATGGHSASAGHGNLFNESYTAYMERDVKEAFALIGIDFVARNHAMGGTHSASEIALCWDQVFGTDVDIFSWDYGMMEAGSDYRFFLYTYRGVLSPGHPAFVGIQWSEAYRHELVQAWEKNGMTAFYEDMTQWGKITRAAPDSQGKSMDEIMAMPEYVRNFRCGDDGFESGDPFCGEQRYSDYMCHVRQAKAPWHPGFKTNAMIGHSISLFLLDSLLGALQDLAVNHKEESLQELISQLRDEDDDIYQNQLLPADVGDFANGFYRNQDEFLKDNFDASVLFRDRGLCRTARLPAQSRYLGYVTETGMLGGPAPVGEEEYDVGMNFEEAYNTPPSNATGFMQLAFCNAERDVDCSVTLKPDYKDFFTTRDGLGWSKMILPNAAEKKAYNYDPSKMQGHVLVVFKTWTCCTNEGCLQAKDLNDDGGTGEKSWEMKINGKSVERLANFGNDWDAYLAVGDGDDTHFPPNSLQEYEVEFKVNQASSHLEIFAVMLF